jgi:ribosomal protein L34E
MENVNIEKKSRGRPQFLEINTKRTDKDYYKNYYKKQLCDKIICNHCGSEILSVKFKRHQQTKKCLKHQNIVSNN